MIEPILGLRKLKLKRATKKDLFSLFGYNIFKKSKNNKKLLNYAFQILKERADFLDKFFGDERWKKIPLLLVLSSETVLKRAKVLDRYFKTWRSRPRLLLINSDRLIKRMKLLKKLFKVENDVFVIYFFILTIKEEKLINIYNKILKERSDVIYRPFLIPKYLSTKKIQKRMKV
ncbi:MAG: hypothetical protein QXO12_03080 [Candidatus Pacearchaeota archaeon]